MLRNELLAAFMLLTRLPVAGFLQPDRPAEPGRCVWAFPLVGVVVNGAGALAYGLASRLGMPPLLAAAWTLATTIVMTGGFHEDGLADTADGFGGGATTARKLEIMRDSRIGSYGALALMLSVAVRMAAISALQRPLLVAAALIAAGMLGRGGMLLLPVVLAPARAGGLGASLGEASRGRIACAIGLAAAAAFLLLPGGAAIAVVVLGLGGALLMAVLARSQIGGYTGDVFGATEVVVECVALSVLAARLHG